MILIYLTLVLFAVGILFWIAAGIINKQKSKQSKKKRKKLDRMANKLGTIAKFIFIAAAICFILGFITLQGSQMK